MSVLERSVSCPIKDGNRENNNDNNGTGTNANSLLSLSPKCSIASSISGSNQLPTEYNTPSVTQVAEAAAANVDAPTRKRSLIQMLFAWRRSSALPLPRRSVVDNPLADIEIDAAPERPPRAHHLPLRARFHRCVGRHSLT